MSVKGLRSLATEIPTATTEITGYILGERREIIITVIGICTPSPQYTVNTFIFNTVDIFVFFSQFCI